MNIILITGASSGIGKEFALQMDEHFSNIDEFWLVARDYERLTALSNTLKHKCRIFACDITQDNSLDLIEDTLIIKNATVRMLINCAGYGIMGAFSEQELHNELGMIRLN